MCIRKKVGIILISIGLAIPTVPKIEEYKNIEIEKKTIKEYINNENKEYYMVLEIPKIKLLKGIYPIKSANNNIEKNVKILEYSNLNNNFIVLASHSGTSSNAYFSNLDKLSVKDLLYIYHNNKKYTYIIESIYYIEKTGELEFMDDYYNKLILITCSLTQNNKQLIIESHLQEIVEENVK